MKFKVGDIIKGKNKRYMFTNESMKKAKVLIANENDMEIEIIEHFWEFLKGERYIVRNSTKYFELIEEKKFTKSDLKDGDIVTRRDKNKSRVYKKENKIIRIDDNDIFTFLDDYTEDLKNAGGTGKCLDIIKVERPVKYETVYERVEEEKKEILDKVEKNYLTNVIKPFKKRFKGISKIESPMLPAEKEFLQIQLNNDEIILPYFEKGTMYKEMELNKRYTLEELGI